MRVLLPLIGIALLAAATASPAHALTLAGELPEVTRRVGIEPAQAFDAFSNAIADSAARQLPVLAASAGFTYRYNAQLEAFERTSDTLGPLFLERPDTLGRGKFNVNVSFQYVQLDTLDGEDTGDLTDPNPIVVDVSDAAGNQLGRTANGLRYGFKLINNISAVSVTYGVLDDFDVNIFVPVISTDYDVNAHNTPLNVVSGAPGLGPPQSDDLHGNKFNLGDILLRAKYELPRYGVMRWAAGLQFRLPTGDENNFQGVGSFEASPGLYASAVFMRRFEAYWNAAVDLRADDVSRSEARYGFGMDADITRRAGLAIAFLGRSEFARIAPAGSTSFLHQTPSGALEEEPLLGIDFGRNDYFDFSFGGRLVVWRDIMIFANGIKAINTDTGLRSSRIIPTIGVEGTF